MDISTIIDKKFGKWLVIREQGTVIEKTKEGWNKTRQMVLCKCQCGTEREVRVQALLCGYSTTCGCSHKDRPNRKTHGLSHSTEHNTWTSIKNRCTNPNEKAYKYYGGRGIKICDRWLGKNGFVNFLKDMGERPEDKESIDRIDVNGDYEPNNCRWADRAEQMNNKTSNVKITYEGKTQSLARWAKEKGMSYYTLYFRIVRDKIPVEEAFTREYQSKPNASRAQRKLSDEQILEIYKCPDRSEDIAKRYGVWQSAVIGIKNRTACKDVTKDAGEPVKSARKPPVYKKK